MWTVPGCMVVFLVFMFFSSVLYARDYTVAVRAHHGVEVAFKMWQPTIFALNKAISEHEFSLIPIVSLDEISRRVGQGEFDFVLTNPSSYVEIEQLYGAKALLTLNNKRANMAQDRFGSVIFTHVNNLDILTIRDLRGKRLMAVSEPAFGGWRVAWMEMLDQSFNPYRDLKNLQFTSSGIQPDVVRAVLDGEVDAGVVRTDQLERMEAAGQLDMRYLRIINNKDVKDFPFFLSTNLYPEWVFAATRPLSSVMEGRIKQLMLSLHPLSPAAKAGKYMGWLTPRDYGSVRELMQRLRVGPYAQRQLDRGHN